MFLKLFGGGIVASATMAEAGALAEFMDWLRRKPVSVQVPRNYAMEVEREMWDEINRTTIKYIADNPVWLDTLLRERPMFRHLTKFNESQIKEIYGIRT